MHRWIRDAEDVSWDELSELYRRAPLGDESPEALRTVFGNSRFVSFVAAGGALIGAGRALADGLDCAYIADVAVHPEHQGRGLGQEITVTSSSRVRGTRRSSSTPIRGRRASTSSWGSCR